MVKLLVWPAYCTHRASFGEANGGKICLKLGNVSPGDFKTSTGPVPEVPRSKQPMRHERFITLICKNPSESYIPEVLTDRKHS